MEFVLVIVHDGLSRLKGSGCPAALVLHGGNLSVPGSGDWRVSGFHRLADLECSSVASQLPAHQQAAFCACAESASATVLEAVTNGRWSHLLCFLLGPCMIPAAEAIVWCRRHLAQSATRLLREEPIARRPHGRLYRPKRRDSSAKRGPQRRRRGRGRSLDAR